MLKKKNCAIFLVLIPYYTLCEVEVEACYINKGNLSIA